MLEKQSIIFMGKDLFNKVPLYIVLMMNPDGVTISQFGPNKMHIKTLWKNIVKILGKTPYKWWKAYS